MVSTQTLSAMSTVSPSSEIGNSVVHAIERMMHHGA
jgi:hypothetical protein